MPPVSYTARVVCPMTGPPLGDAGVLVEDGSVLAVGAAAWLRREAARTHHVDGVLLPGLVNGHTRFEYADARAADPAAGSAPVASWDDDRWRRSAHRGVQEALRAGVTAAGDVVQRGPGVPAAARARMAGDSYIEVPAASDLPGLVAAVDGALDQPAPGRRLGVAPMVAPDEDAGAEAVRALAALAARRHVPLRVPPGWEVAALDDCEALLAGGSISVTGRLAAGDAGLLAERRVTVVWRTGADQGFPDGCAEAGGALAFGTGDDRPPSVLDEAAAWAHLARASGLIGWPAGGGRVDLDEQAVRLATIDGAAALGWDDHAGVLAPGRRADLAGVAVDTGPATVYEDLLASGPGREVLTVVDGVRKARRGRADEPWPPVERTRPGA